MKKILFLLSVFSNLSLYAQDVYNTMAMETCNCINAKKGTTSNPDTETLVLNVGFCILESYNNHETEIPESDRVIFSDENGMEKLGEKVALKMLSHCPDYVMELGQHYIESEKNAVEVEESTLEGRVTAIETKLFVVLKIKDKNDRVHSLLFLDYFDTASLFTEGKIKVGTNLIVGYSNVELYDPEIEDFKYFKVISRLEKK